VVISIARVWKLQLTATASAAIFLVMLAEGEARVSLPGIRGDLTLSQWAPFILTAAAVASWVDSFVMYEHGAARRPWAVRTKRLFYCGSSPVAAAVGIELLNLAYIETLAISIVCLAASVAVVRASVVAALALPLCINYFYYAARIHFSGGAVPLLTATAVFAVCSLIYVVVPGRPR
jgi:hypothetical protein